ncbi:nuclear transport factor 2 family protein [Nodosilinea sp. E11]|uniref:nuclear transport factor 2 family protein n=1 Tax=Nodosilinea sp. E11 TaxID=3037479 RepID=UPI002934C832|nr:ketosteroid isomerase family protein [Nodosilinea sp. E11]WOD41489.1 ketosteroid isomerase family protein [Nodosilinea sp. E11]
MATRTAEATLNLAAIAPVVDRYFTGFNAEDYHAVADLFGADGVLFAPFEDPIVGAEAVYTYLQAEAIAMRATPLEAEVTPMSGEDQSLPEDGIQQVVVNGRVKTLLFSVSVRWTFVLTAANTIRSAEIKLLASLQELMAFDRG